MKHIITIGAGQAGAALVARLRSAGHKGPITLIGDEPSPPYQRPPLSKAYLMGVMEAARPGCGRRNFMPNKTSPCGLAARSARSTPPPAPSPLAVKPCIMTTLR